MSDDTWAALVSRFADDAYASVKGYVRTYVMHQQLLENLPHAPASVLDVGGGAGHQSFPLAEAGYDVTVLDSSPAMLEKARERLARLPAHVQHRVTFVEADGERADEAVDGRQYAAVLCHGVLGYLEQPERMIDQLCRCAAPAGIVSIMTGNAKAAAVQPALERRWEHALAAFDSRTSIGVLGLRGRADTVEEISELLLSRTSSPWAGTECGSSSTGSSSAASSWTWTTRSRSSQQPPSSSRPAAETPTVSSAGSFTWSGARIRADRHPRRAELSSCRCPWRWRRRWWKPAASP